MLQRIQRMLIKEFLQMLRDPRMRIVIFGVPVIQMIIMAFALTTDVMNIRTAVLDMDKTPGLPGTDQQVLPPASYFRISCVSAIRPGTGGLLDRGDVRAVMQIPSGFEHGYSAQSGQPPFSSSPTAPTATAPPLSSDTPA